MVADIESLRKQNENLKEQLVKEKKTNQLLKKRAVQAIVGNNGAAPESDGAKRLRD